MSAEQSIIQPIQEFYDEVLFPYPNSQLEDISNNIPNQQSNVEIIVAQTSNLHPPQEALIDSVYLNSVLHPKYGSYKPLSWNVQTIIDILHSTNDGRYILADSEKKQLQMVTRFLSNSSLNAQDLKLGLGKDVHPLSTEFPDDLLDKLPEEFTSHCFSFSWIEYKGIYYRKKILLVLENNLDGCIFGEVVFIFVGKSKIPFFLCNPIHTVGFDNHFHAFEVVIDSSDSINYSKLTGCYINELYDIIPTVPRVLGNFKTYATLRYAL